MKPLLVPLVLSALLSGLPVSGQATAGLDPNGQVDFDGFVPVERLETYDGTLIGVALGPARPIYLPQREAEATYARPWLAVQRVRVEDSRAFPTGATVAVYFVLRGYEPTMYDKDDPKAAMGQEGALPVGRRVLVFGAKAQKSVLPRPYLFDPRGPTALYALPAEAGPSAFGFGWVATTKSQLAPVTDPMWRFLESVAGAVRGSDEANLARVDQVLRNVRFPGWETSTTNPILGDRFSSILLGMVESDTAYHRARMDLILNEHDYVGSGDRYLRDLKAAALDPNAFPGGVGAPRYWEHASDPAVPEGFRHDPIPTPDDVVALLKSSRSPTVAAFYLGTLQVKPTDADVRAMARFLDSPDPRLRRAFVERLALWNGEATLPDPKEVGGGPFGKGRMEYPGLDEAVARWKARLGRG